MENQRKFKFSWDLLGDLESGRPNLGHMARLEVYRLLKFCIRDAIEVKYGTKAAEEILFDAGKIAGREFYQHLIGEAEDFATFSTSLQNLFEVLKIGIIHFEKADQDKHEFLLTVSEDLDCSGLPENDLEICIYDEGLLAAIFECFYKKKFTAKEIDCWCSGDRTCRFRIKALNE